MAGFVYSRSLRGVTIFGYKMIVRVKRGRNLVASALRFWNCAAFQLQCSGTDLTEVMGLILGRLLPRPAGNFCTGNRIRNTTPFFFPRFLSACVE